MAGSVLVLGRKWAPEEAVAVNGRDRVGVSEI